MIELLLASDDMATIQNELVGKGEEGCAILFANEVKRSDGTIRLLAQEMYFPAPDEYTRRGELEAELRPETVARVSKRANREGFSLVFVHSHPGHRPPEFSPKDDEGEQHLSAFLGHRAPARCHAALVLSQGGASARRLGSNEFIRVVSVGHDRRVPFDPYSGTDSSSDIFDRQVRAFGAEGQRALGSLRIAVVGLGGIGAIVSQQLVHLGVREFILVDPDVIEPTNLNRVPNATMSNVGMAKVQVAEQYIHLVAPDAKVLALKEDIIRTVTARKILDADIIFCCTDSHGSRAVLQQIAYQYFIPCIDIGTVVAAEEDTVTHIYGRVQLLAPDLSCLTCDGLLDSGEVRRDMMTAFERQNDPYLMGPPIPAPAVMSLNGTVASLAVTMLLSVVAGLPAPARHIIYNAKTSTLRSARGNPDSSCYICSHSGARARGDTWPIFGRDD